MTVSREAGRLDYFVIARDTAAYHKYWDGSGTWFPAGKYHERMDGKFTSGLAAATWSEGRIDLVGKGTDDEYYHLHLNDSNWQPDVKDWEDFGMPTSCVAASALCRVTREDAIPRSEHSLTCSQVETSAPSLPPFLGDQIDSTSLASP
jgi:hypothetical protein